MDFGMIASEAITAIAPFLVKGGEALAAGVGNELWELIKKPFQTEKDKAIINQFEKNPADPKTQGKLEMKLSDLLEANQDVADRINFLLSDAQKESQRISIEIQNSKNVVVGSGIQAGGNVIIGDK